MAFQLTSLNKPSLIVANGVAYLGIVEQGESSVTVKSAMGLGSPKSIGTPEINEYMVTAYSEKLTTVQISQSSSWSSTVFDEDLNTDWEIAKLRLEKAIKAGPINSVLEAFKKG